MDSKILTLAQCRKYLRKKYPSLQFFVYSYTRLHVRVVAFNRRDDKAEIIAFRCLPELDIQTKTALGRIA